MRAHTQAMSLVVFTNRLMSGVIALSYVEIVRALTAAGSFLAFTALSAVSVVFYYKCVPETAGKTLEQVRSMSFHSVYRHACSQQSCVHVLYLDTASIATDHC
jgi:Sugar (and other) transporter